jgi:hypothetical protein
MFFICFTFEMSQFYHLKVSVAKVKEWRNIDRKRTIDRKESVNTNVCLQVQKLKACQVVKEVALDRIYSVASKSQ